MLLRLSRASFWLATAVAAWALVAPAGHETSLVAIVLTANALAFGLWRSALRTQRRGLAGPDRVPEAVPLDEAALRDAAVRLVDCIRAAGSLEAALHAAGHVLRGELGAREVGVVEVQGVAGAYARLRDLVATQPGFRSVERRALLNTRPFGRALRERSEACDPDGTAAVPVVRAGRVVAMLELVGIGVAVEPRALTGLLRLARLALSSRAGTGSVPASDSGSLPAAAGQARAAAVLVVDDNGPRREATAGLLRGLGCHVVAASGMLEGLAAPCRTQFDMVLVDLQVSETGQAEGWDWLCRNPEGVCNVVSLWDTLVIALTPPGWPADGERIRELGFDDHTCQPPCPARMSSMLTKHLRLHAAESDAAPTGGIAGQAEPPPALDAAALARLSELDPTGANRLVDRVLQAFQTSAARLWPQAEAARASGDRATLRLVAHTLKSSSASIGAMRLSQLCAEVESAIRLDSPDDLGPMLDAMGTALDAALQVIAQALKDRA
jgi:HPt (histidine-containing phosphotransfer) domain-containing protein